MLENTSLKWNNYRENITSSFRDLRNERDFSDVTLVCKGNQRIEAHKVVLAATSPVFKEMLQGPKQSRLFIYMRGINAKYLTSIVDFIYQGEICILQDDLNIFLALSEKLQLKGITGNNQTDLPQVKSSSIKAKQTIRKSKQNQDISRVLLEKVKIENFEAELPVYGPSDATKAVDETNISDLVLELDSLILTMVEKTDGIWKCQKGGKTNTGKRNIINHIEAMHMEETTNSCNQCGKLYRSRSLLKSHVSFAHSG